MRLTARNAKAVTQGKSGPIPATIMMDERPHSAPAAEPNAGLAAALDAARARGIALHGRLLAAPAMLNTAAMAERLGMSEEGVRLKRKRHEILGLEFAKRGIRYPSWQVLPDGRLVPGLPRVFALLGDDRWRVYRFLEQHHSELGGQRAREALRRGQVEAVLGAAENAASGAFA
jgi:hypothetical protein